MPQNKPISKDPNPKTIILLILSLIFLLVIIIVPTRKPKLVVAMEGMVLSIPSGSNGMPIPLYRWLSPNINLSNAKIIFVCKV